MSNIIATLTNKWVLVGAVTIAVGILFFIASARFDCVYIRLSRTLRFLGEYFCVIGFFCIMYRIAFG